MRPRLEVYFDYSSPFAYLGCTQVRALAERTGAELVLRPFLLGALFRSIGTPLVPLATFPKVKRDYLARDLERWAEWWNVPYRFNSHFPLRTVEALRLTLAAPEPARLSLMEALMGEYWARDRPADRAGLAEVVQRLGLDRGLLDAIDLPEAKAALHQATDAAVARGVPGAPTFVVTREGVPEELFWGQDRLFLAEHALGS